MFKIIIIFIVIVFLIALCYTSHKKRKEKLEEKKRLEKAREEKELQNRIDRIKTNETIIFWVNTMCQNIEENIANNPYLDREFHLRAFNQEIAFGENLQSIYLPNLNKYTCSEHKKILQIFRFDKNGLPNLKPDQHVFFESVLCEMISSNLSEKEIYVEIEKIIRTLEYGTFHAPDFCYGEPNFFTHAIIYTAKKIDGSW
ncbi:MAG: hypothetical protein J6A83_06715 [Clostridia bacterium]|nr:hypothetical protein [Clostridia bacterium]